MGQIWVRRKNHPGAEKLWGGSLLSVLKKKTVLVAQQLPKWRR